MEKIVRKHGQNCMATEFSIFNMKEGYQEISDEAYRQRY